MNEYHEEKKKHEGSSQAPRKAAAESSAGGSRSALAANPRSSSNQNQNEASREMILHLPLNSQSPSLETSPLSSMPKNINAVYGADIDPTQQFLLYHCESLIPYCDIWTIIKRLGLYNDRCQLCYPVWETALQEIHRL